MNPTFVRFVDRNLGIPLCRLLALHRVKRATLPPAPEQVQRIAVLKLVGIGNLVMASPTLASLRRRYPRARLTFVTLTSNRRLLETSCEVDQVVYLDANRLCGLLASTARLLRQLRRDGTDLIVDLEPHSRFTALLSCLSGARWRVGFDTADRARGSLYNLPVAYPEGTHRVAAFHRLAERLGAPRPERLELSPLFHSLEDEAAIESFALRHEIDPTRPLVGIHVGTGDNTPIRRWPLARFAELAEALIEEYGAQVVFTGSPKEAPLVAAVIGAMRAPAIDASGRLTIPQLAGLIGRCSLFVAAGTGPLHIAAAMRVPAVGLYGPCTPAHYGPWGEEHTVLYHPLPCSPCLSQHNDEFTRCAHGECLQSITVGEVLDAIRAQHRAWLHPEVLVG